MSNSAYLYQLIGQMLGADAQAWLNTPNPDFPGTPKPQDLVDCAECHDMVLRHLEGLCPTDAAVLRAEGHLTGIRGG